LYLLSEKHQMEQLTDIAQYHGIVERYRRPGCLSNDYLQTRAEGLIARGQLEALCFDDNAYLLEHKDGFRRLYYYLNDLDANDKLQFQGDVVTEILYRGAVSYPDAEVAFLERMGFERNLVRDQYAAVYRDLVPAGNYPEVNVRPARDIDEVQWACQMFNAMFDRYSGDYIPEESYGDLLAADSILMAVDNKGDRVGALHQTLERNVTWISHVAVVPAARGQHVGAALVDAFVERNHVTDKSRYMLWVQQHNTAAVAMYEKKGFTNLGKSTLSLIRK
jgi:GNAT superfamily N-acetyltransferase